jgi:hypothetical protein
VTNLLEKENKPSLEDFAVLHGFRDVFMDEILELAPRREIYFSIDLLPRSAPISKAPYRMSLPKLTKLKIQLQELLEKKISDQVSHLREHRFSSLKRNMGP